MSEQAKRVLIVDAESGVRDALGRLLRRHGMDVSTAVGGNRALRRLRSGETFDCVIVDLLLPDMTGHDFISAIGEGKLLDLARILILTAFHNVDNATAYLQYGCSGYLGKPYDNARILQQVQRACGIEKSPGHLESVV